MDFKFMENTDKGGSAYTPKKSVFDGLGRKKTLLSGEFAYIRINVHDFSNLYSQNTAVSVSGKKNLLILGIGENLHDILPHTEQKEQIYLLDCPEFLEQFSPDIPQNFRLVTKESLFSLLNQNNFSENTDILFYKQNLQLFPRFWTDILTDLRQFFLPQTAQPQKERHIFLSGSPKDLLHRELMQAICDLGCIPVELGYKSTQEILELLDTCNPVLYLSINAGSLDSNGILYSWLKKKHIPLAIWFADNVWNIVSGINQDWWKDCPLFLTDFSFSAQLQAEGAKKVYSLPLASHNIPTVYTDIPQIPLFFVGNSSFANKNKYFSGCKLDRDFEQNLYRQVQKNLESKQKLPDFHEIRAMLFPNEKLWLTASHKTIGYAAANADLFLRKLWLESLSPLIQIMGDNAWQDILKTEHIFHAPVNYYTTLPSYYKNSFFTLNLTSLLMPANLSQRHFDVWKHHGFLLSSPGKGMEIFPHDIIPLITAENPQDCLSKLEYFLTRPQEKSEIQKIMQNEINAKHTYAKRLQYILDTF